MLGGSLVISFLLLGTTTMRLRLLGLLPLRLLWRQIFLQGYISFLLSSSLWCGSAPLLPAFLLSFFIGLFQTLQADMADNIYKFRLYFLRFLRNDFDRFKTAASQIVDKRLTWKQATGADFDTATCLN